MMRYFFFFDAALTFGGGEGLALSAEILLGKSVQLARALQISCMEGQFWFFEFLRLHWLFLTL